MLRYVLKRNRGIRRPGYKIKWTAELLRGNTEKCSYTFYPYIAAEMLILNVESVTYHSQPVGHFAVDIWNEIKWHVKALWGRRWWSRYKSRGLRALRWQVTYDISCVTFDYSSASRYEDRGGHVQKGEWRRMTDCGAIHHLGWIYEPGPREDSFSGKQ